jgi:hypothetical protein
MNKSELQKIIREEVRKTLNEGAITIAMGLGLQGEVKTTVQALETYLKSIDAILDYKNARILAELIIDIIDAAKQEQNDEVYDDGYPTMDGGRR